MSKEIILPEKKVIVRFKKSSDRPEFTQPKHALYGGKLNNSIDKIPLPIDDTGNKVEVLSREEMNYLAEITNKPAEYYSVFSEKGYFRIGQDYSRNYSVPLTKEDLILTLSKVKDYIDYKILLKCPTLVASNITKVNNSDTIKWYILETDSEAKETDKALSKRKCYKILDSIEGNRFAMKFIMNSLGKKTSREIPDSKLEAMVVKEIEENPERVFVFLTDEFIAEKGLITEAIERGILQIDSEKISAPQIIGSITFEGQNPIMDNVAKFLSEPKNSETKAKILALIQKQKK